MSVVSVIIPVYKAEQYLKECVHSVLQQDYSSIEIILVDDGSPDACPTLCDEFAGKYHQIKVIHQMNSGASAARNNGLKVATGDYICFLDSDDCLDGNIALSVLVSGIEKDNADIVVGSFRRITETGCGGVNEHHLKGGNYTETVDFRFKGFYMYGHLAYSGMKMYRKAFLEKNKLYMDEYLLAEDKAFNIRCCAVGAKYAFVNKSVYLYRINSTSATAKYTKNFSEMWISIAEDFETFLKDRGITRDYNDLMYFHIFFGSFFLAKQELQFKTKGIREAAGALKEYCKNPFVKKSMKALAQGKYLKEIDAVSWKIVIRAASLCMHMHGYFLMALGIALLRKLDVDKRITKSRYKKKENQ